MNNAALKIFGFLSFFVLLSFYVYDKCMLTKIWFDQRVRKEK